MVEELLKQQAKAKELKKAAELAYASARNYERLAMAEPDPRKRKKLLAESNHDYRIGRMFVKERQKLLGH